MWRRDIISILCFNLILNVTITHTHGILYIFSISYAFSVQYVYVSHLQTILKQYKKFNNKYNIKCNENIEQRKIRKF